MLVTNTGVNNIYIQNGAYTLPPNTLKDLSSLTLSTADLSILQSYSFAGSLKFNDLAAQSAITSAGNTSLSNASRILAQTGVPCLVPPSCTISALGVITLSIALTNIYTNVWVALPAGIAYTGSPAGMYYAQFSSTTIGTVYSNYASPATTSFTPYIPAILGAPVVGTTVASGTMGQTAITNVQIPGGIMGNNGRLRCNHLSSNGGANGLMWQFYGGNSGGAATISGGGTGSFNTISNCGSQSSNVYINGPAGDLAAGYGILQGNLNTANTWAHQYLGTPSSGTGWIMLNTFTIEVLPSA